MGPPDGAVGEVTQNWVTGAGGGTYGGSAGVISEGAALGAVVEALGAERGVEDLVALALTGGVDVLVAPEDVGLGVAGFALEAVGDVRPTPAGSTSTLINFRVKSSPDPEEASFCAASIDSLIAGDGLESLLGRAADEGSLEELDKFWAPPFAAPALIEDFPEADLT
jgi:hypothetical protein